MIPERAVCLRVVVCLLIGMAPGASLAGDTIDFEPPYVTGTALDGQDGWRYWWLTHSTAPADFQPDDQGLNNVLRCETHGLTEYHRPMDPMADSLELTWRWRASSSTARLNFGPCDELTSTNNNYWAYRARVVMDAGTWKAKGAGWITPQGAGSTWEAGRWYYLRLKMSIAAGRFSVWVDTAAARTSEIRIVDNEPAAGSGPVDRVLLKADQGTGAVDLDDILWGEPPGPGHDGDGDGVPDLAEAELGTSPTNSFPPPRVAMPDTWELNPDASTTIYYDYGVFDSYASRRAVPVTIPAGALEGGLAPIVTMTSTADTSLPPLPLRPNEVLLSGMFDIRGTLAPDQALRMAFPLPDGFADITGGPSGVRLLHEEDGAWTETAVDSVVHGLVYATLTGFSHFGVAGGAVIHVDQGNAGADTAACDGTSWDFAFGDLQDALGVAAPGDTILVARGRYLPGAAREDRFDIPAGVTLLGGFPPGGGALNERRPSVNTTTLTGDIAGDDEVIEGENLNGDDNVYTVVAVDGGGVRIDGFTITGGYADGAAGWSATHGGGAAIHGPVSDVTVANCVFTGNTASGAGGALAAIDATNLRIESCLMRGNGALSAGGAVSLVKCIDATVEGVRFLSNVCHHAAGGGAALDSSTVTVARCVFRDNRAEEDAGGLALFASEGAVRNSIFAYNEAGGGGGAVWARGLAGTGLFPVTHCTFLYNSARDSGGALFAERSAVELVNSILWGDKAPRGPELAAVDGRLEVGHCDIDGSLQEIGFDSAAVLVDRGGNIDTPPLFVDALSLEGADGGFGTEDDGIRPMRPGSPCVDSGLAGTGVDVDITGRPRPKGGGADMGAHESRISVVYVNHAAGGGGDGESWETALTDLQDGLDKAQEETEGTDDDIMVWVAGVGPYYPSKRTDPADRRSLSFVVPGRVSLYGGFAATEKALGERRLAHDSLSRLNGNTGYPDNATDDAMHVVSVAGSPVIDGFTISEGRATFIGQDPTEVGGGGIYIVGGSPTIRNCILRENRVEGASGYFGGAILARVTGAPLLKRCAFLQNTSVGGGGAVAVRDAVHLRIESCAFHGNTAGGGSAIALHGYVKGPSLRGRNLVITGNDGMPVSCFRGTMELNNCTIAGNTGSYGVWMSLIADPPYHHVDIRNSILWNPAATEGETYPSVAGTVDGIRISHSAVHGGAAGTGNVAPSSIGFAEPSNPAGPDGWFGTLDDGLRLAAGSACIDGGIGGTAQDVLSVWRPQGVRPDIGAYEYVRRGDRVEVGLLVNNAFVVRPLRIVDLVPHWMYVRRWGRSDLGRVLRAEAPANEYTREKHAISASIIAIDDQGVPLPDAIEVELTFYKMGEKDGVAVYQTRTKTQGKNILFVGHPAYQGWNNPYAYVVYAKAGCSFQLAIPHAQFK